MEFKYKGVQTQWSANTIKYKLGRVQILWSAKPRECQCYGVRTRWRTNTMECKYYELQTWGSQVLGSANTRNMMECKHYELQTVCRECKRMWVQNRRSANTMEYKRNGIQTGLSVNMKEWKHERECQKGSKKRKQYYRSHSLVSKYSGEYRKMEIGTRVIVVL